MSDFDPTSTFSPTVRRERNLGSILSVQGSRANVGIHRSEGSDRDGQGITVGKCICVLSGGVTILGYVTEITVDLPDIARQRGHSASATVELMGEIRGQGDERRFQRGVSEYPMIGDAVVPISSRELEIMYGRGEQESISIGTLQQEKRFDARVNVDDLLSRHFALFGSTGVGKSSGVALILGEVLKVRPNLRVFLLDPHNEYSRCLSDRAQIINPRNLKLPFWLFNFEEFVDVIFGARPGIEEETEILAELIPVAKSMYASQRGGAMRAIRRADPRHTGFSADTPVPYRLADLLSLIDEQMGKLENRTSRMKYHKLMMRIEGVSSDPRYNFMFENANVGGDTMTEVLCHLFRLPPEGKPMTIMELAGFPSEVVDAVVSVLCRLAFDFGLWSEGAVPMLFVCEEAHRYASADRSRGFGPTRRALSRIAKEGRKYGVFLGLVSQRPAELDSTIISQCSTLFIMRMSNDRDQEIVSSAVSDTAANLLHLVPSLGTREVLAFGEGVALPTRMTFRVLPETQRPSREVLGNARSIEEVGDPHSFVQRVVARWRQTNASGRSDESYGPEHDGALGQYVLPPDPPAEAFPQSPLLKEGGLQRLGAGSSAPGRPERRTFGS
jgi:uncharacterized protein